MAAALQIPSALNNATASNNADGGAGANPGNDIADNEFMQLLGTLIKGDTDSSNSSITQPASASGKSEKDAPTKDDSATSLSANMPVWLMATPIVAQSPPAMNVPTTETDETDALTSVGNSATNAVLAQTLKQLSNGKNEAGAGDNKTEKSDSNSELPSFLLKGAAPSPLDAMLKSASTADADSSNRGSKLDVARIDADNGNASSIPMMQALHQTATDASNVTVQVKVESRMDSHQWADEIGNHLSVLVANKSHSASLQLTPDNLGPVQVKIEVNNNQANVWFTADHPDTRTALEQSLPRLRELFASQGMSLMDAGVFSQESQQQAPMFSRNAQPSYGMTDMSTDVTSTQVILKVGLLDTYA